MASAILVLIWVSSPISYYACEGEDEKPLYASWQMLHFSQKILQIQPPPPQLFCPSSHTGVRAVSFTSTCLVKTAPFHRVTWIPSIDFKGIFTHNRFVTEMSATEKKFHLPEWGGFGSKNMDFCKPNSHESGSRRNFCNKSVNTS